MNPQWRPYFPGSKLETPCLSYALLVVVSPRRDQLDLVKLNSLLHTK